MNKNYKFMLLTFGVSVLIWLQINLLREQDTTIQVPVQITNLPENLYVYPEVNIKMPIRVRGRGINIVVYNFSEKLVIYKATNAVLGINDIDMVAGELVLPNTPNLTFFTVPTDTDVTFTTDRILQKIVPVSFEFHSEKDKQFLIDHNFLFEDYFVTISGPSQLINEVDHVRTEKIGSDLLKLSNQMIKITPTSAHIIAVPQLMELQKVSDIQITKTLIMIPINYNRSKITIFPDRVTVKIEGNQNIVNNITNDDIHARVLDVDYQDNTSTALHFDVPPGVKIIDFTPNEVRITVN